MNKPKEETTCLMCGKKFMSPDKRAVRYCMSCRPEFERARDRTFHIPGRRSGRKGRSEEE